MNKPALNICTICNAYSSKRLTSMEKHLNDVHSTTLKDEWIRLNGKKTCQCGCGGDTAWAGWRNGFSKFVLGHNAYIYSSYDEETAKELSKTRGKNWRGKPAWCRGLTKETDERVLKRAKNTAIAVKAAFDSGEREAWSKGLTKETDSRVLSASLASKEAFKTGERVMWHQGLTAATSISLKLKNDSMKQKYADGILKPWLKGSTVETDERIAKIWQHRGDPLIEYANVRFSNEEIEDLLSKNTNISLDRIENYRHNRSLALWVHCRSCSWSDTVTLLFAKNDRCPNCNPMGSKNQHEIADFIQSFQFSVGRNVKGLIGKHELDIFVPQKNLAIEFNGLYYHNENAGKGSWYHDNKTTKCQQLGITLLHVFEDEWLQKQDIIKSMIKHRLGVTEHKIDARKCLIRKMTLDERKLFFDSHHIDGDGRAKESYCLTHNNIIVAAISFKKSIQKNHKNSIEIIRACSILNTSVRGWFSKLINVVKCHGKKQGYDKIVSFVDSRYEHKINKSKEWKFISDQLPKFWWTENHVRLTQLNKRQVESQKYSKIWGCRAKVYEICLQV
jgi:hypothetical protein